MKFYSLLLLVAILPLTVLTGCRSKQAPPPPPPIPTPAPPTGNVVFTQSGHLVKLSLRDSQVTPLTSGKSTEWFPACSPKGGQVAYWSDAENGIYNLWKVNLEDSKRVQLTFNDESILGPGDLNLLLNNAPAWTADGKNIVYVQDGNIWQIDADGFNPETLLSGHSALCAYPSPDGKTVVYVSNENDSAYNLFLLTLSDRTVKKLTSYTDWNAGSPSYSADGKKILYNLFHGDSSQIYTVNLDGSEATALTNDLHSLCPRYAQNGAKILYCSYGNSEEDSLKLYLMNANGADAKTLPTDDGASPSWGPESTVAPASAPAKK
jgi:Tol biopolymer transport system component